MYYNNYNNLNQLNPQQLQMQLQQMQNQYSQMQQMNSARGSFIQVKDYQDVINYPTDASGMPTLFMNETSGVFWVKKFIDGTNKIQAYQFAPINDYTQTTNKKEEELSPIENLQQRMVKIEDNFEKIFNLLKGEKKE